MGSFDLMHSQILHQIKKCEAELDRIRTEELSSEDRKTLFDRYTGGLDQLNLVLTVFDNPLSNFQADETRKRKK